MQQRKVAGVSGRPVGTDGSDYSYRMVVESRYTKVAKGKAQLYRLIIVQAIIQWLGLLSLMLPALKEKIYRLAIASHVISALAFVIGGLGLKRSKVNLLKFFMVASSIAVLLLMSPLNKRTFLIEIIRNPSQWQTNKFLFLEIVGALLGVLLQIFAISTTISLVRNMFPPRKTS